MDYVGVEFLGDGGGIAVVHSSWLTPLKKEAFWPPYKTSNLFNKAIVTPEEPDQSSWKLYPIKRLFFECDNFEKAQKKLKKCEETSDIQSSESDLDLTVRKRFTSKRCLSSSEDEEPLSKLPRPPIFPKVIIKPGSSNSKKNLTDTPRPTRGYNDDKSGCNKSFTSTPTTCQRALLKPQASRETFSASPSSAIPEDEDITSSLHSEPVLSDSNRTITVSANGLEKIFKEIRKLREELKEVKGLFKQSRNSRCVISCLPNDIPVEFPLTSITNLKLLEEYLNIEDDKLNDLASYFSTLGGNGTHAQVNKILRMVMSDHLAANYNFAGQRNKQAFGSTKLTSVIIRAIQITSPSTTNADIENAVKIWLKHAKQRIQKKEQNSILE